MMQSCLCFVCDISSCILKQGSVALTRIHTGIVVLCSPSSSRKADGATPRWAAGTLKWADTLLRWAADILPRWAADTLPRWAADTLPRWAADTLRWAAATLRVLAVSLRVAGAMSTGTSEVRAFFRREALLQLF